MENRGGVSGLPLKHSWWFLFFFSFLLAHSGHSQDQTCNPGDLKALEGFLAAMDSGIHGWSSNASSADCCSFPGISCGPPTVLGRRVVGLDLHNRSLKGSISDSLAGLVNLRQLNLSFNSLRGSVPPQLFSLEQLAFLDLSVNKLSGSIPSNTSLPLIETFNISQNSFHGTLPVLAGSNNLKLFDISGNSFTGPIDTAICNSSARIRSLWFSANSFSGNLPSGFGSCSSLTELAINDNGLSGVLPDDVFRLPFLKELDVHGNRLTGTLSSSISNLSNLVHLDVSFNSFSGPIPDVFSTLGKLESFYASFNQFSGRLPTSLSTLSALRFLNLGNNSLSGVIDLNFASMAQLTSLDLGTNRFTGAIPSNLAACSGLNALNLAGNDLVGEIPAGFKNLTELRYLSLSRNRLSNLSSALLVLQHCRNLSTLVVTRNFQGETMPVDGIQGFESLQLLAVANCGLEGSVPGWLANCSRMEVLDLSWNHLNGAVPSWIGDLPYLFYLDLSNNSLAGEIPQSLTQLRSLISGNISKLDSSAQTFPFFSRRNMSAQPLQYNKVGSFPPSLILSDNMLAGQIPPEFGNLKYLLELDLHKNNISGIIPEELSGMSNLEFLDLSRNNLTGSIPPSFTKLNFLSTFNVAYNKLVGRIPTGGQFWTFSAAYFAGNPGLCGTYSSPCAAEPPSGSPTRVKKKQWAVVVGMTLGIGLGAALLLAVVYVLVSRSHCRKPDDSVNKVADESGHLESAVADEPVLLYFRSVDDTEVSINDIMKSTNNFDQTHIIGCGGFGLVYKATLPDGRLVAVKRLSGDFCQMEREFQAEVDTLSRAQHRNLVVLEGYCRIGNDRLLIYAYLKNGSLDYWLHEKLEGAAALKWGTRLKIARGAARGLVYLHQSCEPRILHRDIKSSNILLDETFEAHLADFGLARLIMPCNTHVTTDLVGTLGYIPPEYGHSSVATYRGDVYSFGVVLLELLTGRRPVDMCKPKVCRYLISWVLEKRKEKEEKEVFDPCIYDEELEQQLNRVLEIACLCVSENPKQRPLTTDVLAWLDDVGRDDCEKMEF